MNGPAAGDLNRRIELQAAETEQDELASTVKTWTTYAKVYAAIGSLSGRDAFIAERRNSEASHRITIRYRKGVTAQHRVLYGGRMLAIDYIDNTQEQGVQLVLFCKELA